MSPESINARIERLEGPEGPFNSNELNGVMGWIWDYNREAFEHLKRMRQGRAGLNEIFDWFETHPESDAGIHICFPPRSNLALMNPLQRLEHIHDTLVHRDNILHTLPESMSMSLSYPRLIIEPEMRVEESGAVQFIMYLDANIEKNMRAKVTVGTVSIDVLEDRVRICEVQREKPAGFELYQLEWAGITPDQIDTRVSTHKTRLRHEVKRGRILPAVLTKGVPWPATEEFFIAAVVESMSHAGVITRDMPVELLNDNEIACSLEDQYVFDRVYERALGRALVSAGWSYIKTMHIDKQDIQEFERIITSYPELGMLADSLGYYFQYQLKTAHKSMYVKDLLLRRIAPEYASISLDACMHLNDEAFGKAILPLTIDYQINYAPYIAAFADLNPTVTPLGRTITQEQLSQLPFWGKME